MHESLQDELKAFEKDLSILLVRFMKICDRVEREGGGSVPRPAVTVQAPPAPAPAAPKPIDFRAYV